MTEPMVSERSDDPQSTVRSLIAATDRLLASLADEGRQAYAGAADSLQQQFRRVRDEVDTMQSDARYEARVAARLVDRYVQENPWTAVGVAAAVGALFGALVATLASRR